MFASRDNICGLGNTDIQKLYRLVYVGPVMDKTRTRKTYIRLGKLGLAQFRFSVLILCFMHMRDVKINKVMLKGAQILCQWYIHIIIMTLTHS